MSNNKIRMPLAELLQCANGSAALRAGSGSTEVSSVEYDSRNVRKGSLFVAVEGFKSDGHNFIRAAIENGASALLINGARAGELSTLIPDGTATLNFDNPFIEQHPGGTASEVATVYSLVNTLTQNLTEIKKVRFQVGGKDVTTIKGHVDLREPIDPNKDLVKQTAAGG